MPTKKVLPARYRIPVPFKLDRPVGLGDVVKRATTAVGIRPCSGCQRRAEALNRLLLVGNSARRR